MNEPTIPTPSEITEPLGHGVTRRWLYSRRIVIYMLDEATRAAVDTWAQHVVADSQAWERSRPFLALHHLENLGMTPYSTRKAEEVARSMPRDLHGRYASVIGKGVIGQTIKIFGTTRLRRLLPQLESQFFFEEAPAVAWLRQGMK